MNKIYKTFSILAMVALVTFGILQVNGRMKDIELDPGKTEKTSDAMKLFPTIAKDQATVHFWFMADGHVTMRVYDMQGREVASDAGDVLREHTIETTVDAAALQNGTYIVRLDHSNGKSLTSKMVVAH